MQIPEGLNNLSFQEFSFVEKQTKVWDFGPCNFAFIIHIDKFNFSSDYLISLQSNRTLFVVLDWAIGNETCDVAQTKVNYTWK